MNFFESLQHFIDTHITLKNVENILQGYKGTGIFVGIALPMFEAFLPILPLIVFVLANAAAYGFVVGFLLSWVGSCLGAFIVFLFCRKVIRRPVKKWIYKRQKLRSMMHWVEKVGFGPLFIVLSIPFTPSSVINVLAGLSDIHPRSFYLATMLGKMIMIGLVTFIGNDWKGLLTNPIQLIIVLVAVAVLWIIGKTIEKKLNNHKPHLKKRKETHSEKKFNQ
ncbi:TVP38/TMEM64 family protein [Scopulibacillus cellulosilyticus]|uniref:TVP38/TMEM64 family membrane protein n=1 Tax=Scopulibacillus cellulosilyticus TaxID=2665665 RepID=A0ABW2PVT3_9BACL